MPPPELLERAAPASVGALVLSNLRAEVPMPRHSGPRAEEAHLRAVLHDVRASGDTEAERETSVTLARLLASRGRDLGVATKLARRALMIADDPELRTELAGWLAGLGETAAAATVLRESVPDVHAILGPDGGPAPAEPEAARTLVKIAVLRARAGDAPGAAEALDEAAAIDPGEAMAIELFGTLAAWAPETVTPEGAAAAYLEAASRRAAAGDKEAAYEDRLRAFEIAPQHAPAADAMADALTARGLPGAADEVTRLHAASAAPEGGEAARAIHHLRVLRALAAGHAARAVGAMLDAGLEAELEGELATKVDEVLSLAGLYELLAARLELRADEQVGAARGETFEALARLYAGPLASPDRSIEAWVEALASDPGHAAARSALRDHAAALHDPAPLAEALIRIGSGPGTDADRASALRELSTLADEKLGDAALASWALEGLAAAGGSGELVHAEKLGLLSREKRQDEELAAARRAFEGADSEDARLKALRRLAAVYQGRPTALDEYVPALVELARALPSERSFMVALERVAHRTGAFGPLAEVLRHRLENATSRVERVRARLGLSAIARRGPQGSEERALEEVLPLLTEAPGHRGAACAALLLATRTARHRERADAMVQLAGPAWPALRAMLLAVAAELYHVLGVLAGGAEEAQGLLDLARRTAEQACEADPSCARAVATLSTIAGDTPDRMGAAAVERAMTTVLPRGVWCEQLSRAFDQLGEGDLALAWTQRWLALRPGSAEAMEQFLRRAAAARDPARISDAVGWVLAQPRPLGDFAEPIAAALHVLLEVDRPRARALGRRALDVLGPRVPILRARLLELSDQSGDPGLAIAVLERYLAAENLGGHVGDLLLELGRRRTDAGDFDGAARELGRAAEAGGDAHKVLAQADALEQAMRETGAWFGSDGLCALAEARAVALQALGPDCASAAASAWRDLGSLRWDLAGDHRSAEDAFFRACELTPSGGVERYARDLCAFAGLHEAIDALMDRAAKAGGVGTRKLRANLLIEAANLATAHQMPERALLAAARAIESDPSRADAVALVEKNAHVEGGIAILDRTYDLLAGAALGCFGRRAAHYRGARQLERRSAVDPALRHAAACFEAVPSEGTSYVLLARLAERAGDPSEAVRALERVAEKASAGDRPVWLKRAASLTGSTAEGVRMRFDLLLRALNARPDPGTVGDVAAAMREIVFESSDGAAATEMVRLRFERAVKASLKKLDGPDGARAAVAMARLALELRATDLAFEALGRAMNADGDIDEFAELSGMVSELAADQAGARAWVETVGRAADKPYSSVGRALLRLAAELAGALGDAVARAAFLVQAVKRLPDDDALVAEADIAVAASGDAALAQRLDGEVTAAARALALVRFAEERERVRDEPAAIAALGRALDSDLLDPEMHERATARLHRMLGEAGRDEDAEALLRAELSRADLPLAARAKKSRDLADLLIRRDDRRGAFEVLAQLAAERGIDAELIAELRGLARSTDALSRYAEVLSGAAGRAPSDAARLELLRELAPLCEELGDREGAEAHYEAIVKLDPADVQALEILEREANERGDHEAIAGLLGRRVALAAIGDRKRMLRLRRAAVLEQRLGRLADAVRELEALLAEAPDDVSAMRFLSDIHERMGAVREAAGLLKRLGELAQTSDEKAEYGLRAAAAYVSAGEPEVAEEILESVAPIAQREDVIELRVALFRKKGDGRALAEALDQLAASSREPAERRAAILLEAARVASSLGDDPAALDRARRALKLAPQLPDAVLESRRLEYRGGGAGTPREAQAAVEDLNRIEAKLDPAQVELHAFLLAEELDVIQGGGAGMRELSKRHAAVGPVPLVALGMAERLVRGKNFEAALPLFEHALAGDLRGMRSRGRVALAAAEAASAAQQFSLAARLLDVAAVEPETQLIAQRKQLELAAALGDPTIARQALEELLRQATGLDRARVLLQFGRLLAPTEPDAAAGLLAEAAPLSSADRTLGAQIADAIARVEAIRDAPPPVSTDPPPAPPPAAAPPAAAPPAAAPPPAAPPAAAPAPAPPSPAHDASAPARPSPRPVAEAPLVVGASEQPSTAFPTPVPRSARSSPPPLPSVRLPAPPPLPAPEPAPAEEAPLAQAIGGAWGGGSWGSGPEGHAAGDPQRSPPIVSEESEEERLQRELAAGSFEAGEQLVALHGSRPERSPDVLAARRQQALLKLGDRAALQKLLEAAVHDGNAVYARAVEHVAQCFLRDATPPAPPPLAAQRPAPDHVAALLFRTVADSAVHEALSLVLDTGLYRRDVGQYQLTGVARVQAGNATPLAEVYGTVARFLGQARTALFHQRVASPAPTGAPPAPPTMKIALLSPPAVVLTGEVREDTPELRYQIGAALTGAMPEHALVNALGDEALRTLIDALLAAFGPVANLPKGNAAVARLGQNLWQLVPPRADRRLRELCADPAVITHEAALAGTRRAMRRAGLFASGSLATTLTQIAPELSIPLEMYLLAPDGLAQACLAHPDVADLVKLSLRTEYAEARWLSAASAARRADGPRSQRWDVK
jgi:hypothetical protein